MWDLDTGYDMTFRNVYMHPYFKPLENYDDYDMAILEFTQQIDFFSYNVAPICVPRISEFNDHKFSVNL